MRVFAAHIDITLRGAHRMGGDGHALDQLKRVALHRHAVGEGAAVALVGVADDVFAGAGGSRHRLPLDARREPRAAAPAQA